MESNQNRRKVYATKYYPLVIPADPAVPITQSSEPQPLSPWSPGVEFTLLVKGQAVTFVRRKYGSEEPITELLVMDDRREKDRPPPKPSFMFIKMDLDQGRGDAAAYFVRHDLKAGLKRYVYERGINVDFSLMESVISDLKSRGLVSDQQTAFGIRISRLRQYMSDNSEKLTVADVGNIIEFVENLMKNCS